MLTRNEYKSRKGVALESETSFTSEIEAVRRRAILGLDKNRRGALGQFFTPLAVAQMMAAMLNVNRRERVRLLDAGVGAGILTAALVESFCRRKDSPQEIDATCVEMDADLIPHLQAAYEKCRKECERNGIKLTYRIYNDDFVNLAASNLSDNLFADAPHFKFDLAILNPPYGKINADSDASRALRPCGIVAPNIYASFLALCAEMLASGGELVAITPRSFCNGTYFKPFRRYFLERMSFLKFHVFDSRKEIFDENILQENIIFHTVKDKSEMRQQS